MVREISVRIQIDTAADISSQRFKYAGGEEAGRAVPCVDDDMQSQERMVVIVRVDLLFDDVHHAAAVSGDQVEAFC